MTATEPAATVPSTTTETDTGQDNWEVIVWDDDCNLIEYVTWVLQHVCNHTPRKASQLTQQIHNFGKAKVWEGNQHQAEQHCVELVGFSLAATLEPTNPLD